MSGDGPAAAESAVGPGAPPPGVTAEAAGSDFPLGHEEVGEPDARPVDRWAHRRAEPRPLAFIWTVYLFVATAMTFAAITGVGGLTLDVYRPAVRVLLATVAVGVVLVWPMIRLSQTAPDEHPAAATIKDLFAIVVPMQAIVWPQWLLAAWPVSVIGAVSVTLTAWAFLVAGLLALFFRYERPRVGESEGGRARHTGRTPMMIGFVLLAGLCPVVGAALQSASGGAWSSSATAWWMLASPVSAVFEISRDRFSSGASAHVLPAHWAAAANVAVVGLVFWFWSLVGRRSPRRVGSQPTSA